MEWAAHLRETLDHLVRMPCIPGFKAHAWWRANDMARREPLLYGDMPAKLTVEMSKRGAEAAR